MHVDALWQKILMGPSPPYSNLNLLLNFLVRFQIIQLFVYPTFTFATLQPYTAPYFSLLYLYLPAHTLTKITKQIRLEQNFQVS